MTSRSAKLNFPWPLHATPRVRLAGRFPLDDRDYAVHYLAPTHALHLYQYHGAIELQGQRFAIQPGDVTISPAEETSAYDLTAPGHHYCIHFDPLPPGPAMPGFTLPLHMRLGPHHEQVVLKIMSIAQLLGGQPGSAPLVAAAAGTALHELLLGLALMHRRNRRPRQAARARIDQAVEQAAEWLAAHIDQPFSMRALTAHVGFSHNYLALHFRRRFGVTVPRYLQLRRMQFARYLVESTNVPIKIIGARVGMSDAQYFNKQFRRWAGCSPTALRSSMARGSARPRPAALDKPSG